MEELALLNQRMNRIERENLRLKRAGAILAVGALIACACGWKHSADAPKVIEADQFLIKDQNGTPRISLGMDPDRKAGLNFYDKDGNPRLGLYVLPDEHAGLTIRSPNKKTRLSLGSGPDETSSICLYVGDEKENRSAYWIGASGWTGMTLRDSHYQDRIDLTVEPDGTPKLSTK